MYVENIFPGHRHDTETYNDQFDHVGALKVILYAHANTQAYLHSHTNRRFPDIFGDVASLPHFHVLEYCRGDHIRVCCPSLLAHSINRVAQKHKQPYATLTHLPW